MIETAALAIDATSALATGARERQEDSLAMSFHHNASDGFAVLSDGMGGHAAGDVASRIIVAQIFAELTLHNPACRAEDRETPALLRHAVKRANGTLGAHANGNPQAAGCGGTVVATTIANGRLHWISVGDSPLYLFRDLTLTRLNADHSMAPQIDLMAERGMLTREEARHHPDRNTLVSALIGSELGEIDCPEEAFALKPGDVLILASDGLQYLPDPIIEAVLIKDQGQDSGRIAQSLMEAIETLNDPSQDNVSLVVMRVASPDQGVNPLRGWLSRSRLASPLRRMQMSGGASTTQHRELWTAR